MAATPQAAQAQLSATATPTTSTTPATTTAATSTAPAAAADPVAAAAATAAAAAAAGDAAAADLAAWAASLVAPPSPDLRDEEMYGEYVLPDAAIMEKYPVAAVPQRTLEIQLQSFPSDEDIAAWRLRGFACSGPVVGNHFEVHRLRRYMVDGTGYRWFQVQWAGWPAEAASWEPVAHLAGCPDMLRVVYQAQGWTYP